LQIGEDQDRERQMSGFTIGEVAKQAGVGIETIRFYERLGLIEEPPRTESGYRQISRGENFPSSACPILDILDFINEKCYL
jgi:hypothetical protein